MPLVYFQNTGINMNIRTIGFAEISETQIHSINDPIFRKATHNMIAALKVCEESCSHLTEDQKNSLAVVVMTQFGEVSSSLEFLTTLKEQNLAKPILFQNSLHNSTLGFITIHLKITGPALTLSADKNSDQAITNTIKSLLSLTDQVLFCSVDIIPEYLKKNYEMAFPDSKIHLGWARSVIISNSEKTSQSKIHQFSEQYDIEKFSYNDLVNKYSKGM